MNQEELNRLKILYQQNELDQDDWQALETAIEQNQIQPEELADLNTLQHQFSLPSDSDTPAYVKNKLLALIEKEKNIGIGSHETKVKERYIRYALAAAAMIAGIVIGFIIPNQKSPATNGDLAQLKQEVRDLRETMMLTMLKDDAPTERLRAVSYSYDLDKENKKIIEALLNTLNTDENINVRLSAVEALQHYGGDAWVREQLVKSIGKQDSPLVQVALAECMVAFKEKKSIQELEKIIQNKETPDLVKKRLESYIKQI
ncbi:MAG: HEAT repeat domain-containing protein [Saprospiraceae bacterium]